MSQFIVPGPAAIFIGVGASDALVFLGWSESGVEMRLIGGHRDVMADFGGTEIPVDVQFMAEQAYMSMTLTKYNEDVLQLAVARRVGQGVAVAGSVESNSVGSLMIAQGYAFPMLIWCPYNQETFQNGVAIPGWLFGAAFLHDEFMRPISIENSRPRPVFRALPVWDSINLKYTLYTNNIGSVPTID